MNRGDFDEYGSGKYQRDSLMHDDDFCFREKIGLDSVNQRGQPNMTVHDFRQFVNDSLLPEMTQERDDGILIYKIFKIFIYLFIYVFCVAHSKRKHPGSFYIILGSKFGRQGTSRGTLTVTSGMT